jgi:hypothetical protein
LRKNFVFATQAQRVPALAPRYRGAQNRTHNTRSSPNKNAGSADKIVKLIY